MTDVGLMCQFIRRMEECGLGPESTANMSMWLYDARETGHDFVVIITKGRQRAYRILNPKAKISIPPYKP